MVLIWLIKVVFYIKKIFLVYIKMSESTDWTNYQKNKDLILNKTKDYYKNDKERLREQARDKYRNLSEEEKNKKRIWKKQIPQYVWRKETKTKRISKKLLQDKKVVLTIKKVFLTKLMLHKAFCCFCSYGTFLWWKIISNRC